MNADERESKTQLNRFTLPHGIEQHAGDLFAVL